MSTETLTCNICPRGCIVTIIIENMLIREINGNRCKNGFDYARKKIASHEREFTSTVLIKDAELPLLPVHSSKPLPREYLPAVIEMIQEIEVSAPVMTGQVIIENILNSGIDIIASRSIPEVFSK